MNQTLHGLVEKVNVKQGLQRHVGQEPWEIINEMMDHQPEQNAQSTSLLQRKVTLSFGPQSIQPEWSQKDGQCGISCFGKQEQQASRDHEQGRDLEVHHPLSVHHHPHDKGSNTKGSQQLAQPPSGQQHFLIPSQETNGDKANDDKRNHDVLKRSSFKSDGTERAVHNAPSHHSANNNKADENRQDWHIFLRFIEQRPIWFVGE